MLNVLNIPVSMPQTNCATRDDAFTKAPASIKTGHLRNLNAVPVAYPRAKKLFVKFLCSSLVSALKENSHCHVNCSYPRYTDLI
jgi:hypothetical protein